jgi:hypothetical protein
MHREDMLELRGTRTRVLGGGSGLPLIFPHGASCRVGWLPLLDTLSQHFDVIAPRSAKLRRDLSSPHSSRPANG